MRKILQNFEYKNFIIKDYKHWSLLLRNKQITLGSMVLIEKDFKKKYGNISTNSHIEFGLIIKDLEITLKKLFSYEKINYLMLMMVDPEVHYHIIPRYCKKIKFSQKIFIDRGWPGLPDFKFINSIDNKTKENLIRLIKYNLDKLAFKNLKLKDKKL